MPDFLTRLVERTISTRAAIRPDRPRQAARLSREDPVDDDARNLAPATADDGGGPIAPPPTGHPVRPLQRRPAVNDANVDAVDPATRVRAPASWFYAAVSPVAPKDPADAMPARRLGDEGRGRDREWRATPPAIVQDPVRSSAKGEEPMPSFDAPPVRAGHVEPLPAPRRADPETPPDRALLVRPGRQPATVQVSIGRIEVRALVPPPPPPAPPVVKTRAEPWSLAQYLNERNRGRR
jgi:hypothetical protein